MMKLSQVTNEAEFIQWMCVNNHNPCSISDLIDIHCEPWQLPYFGITDFWISKNIHWLIDYIEVDKFIPPRGVAILIAGKYTWVSSVHDPYYKQLFYKAHGADRKQRIKYYWYRIIGYILG